MRILKLQLQAALTILCSASAFGAPLGSGFQYQGRLDDGGNPASGNYDLRFAIYDVATGGSSIAGPITNLNVLVTDGLVSTSLDFGGGVFNGTAYWLEIGLRTNGAMSFTSLSPRQPLSPTPYAIYAPNAGNAANATVATTANAAAPGAINAAALQNNAVDSSKIADGSIAASDLSPTVLNSTFWKLGGNSSTTPGVNFLGTSDNRPLELRVNNLRAFQLSPARSNDTINVLSGSPLNAIDPSVMAATIAGGGTPEWFGGPRANSVASDFATVAGGADNHIGSNSLSGVISGGFGHRIADGSSDVTVSGGSFNWISSNTPFATIGGGSQNRIGTNSLSATIDGGFGNRVGDNSFDGAIGGGSINTIGSNSFYATIGGGQSNIAGATEATVSGGRFNNALGFSSVIGGGGGNTNSGAWATVAGGRANVVATNALYATIGGGVSNQVTAPYATIGGGFQNVAGNNEATVGGGALNSAIGFSSVISGGGVNSAEGQYATVPGGFANLAGGNYSFAAGLMARASHERAFVWSSYDNPAPSFQPSRFHVLGTNGLSIDYSAQRPDGGGGKWIVIGGEADFPGTVIQAYNGAKLTDGGVWTDFSDRNGKQNFKPVDSKEILRRVTELSVTTWNYKTEQPSVVHIGPVAQDFHAAFSVGNDDTHIAALDANGVSLAAIQGLNQKLEVAMCARDARISALEKQNRSLEQRLEILERFLAAPASAAAATTLSAESPLTTP